MTDVYTIVLKDISPYFPNAMQYCIPNVYNLYGSMLFLMRTPGTFLGTIQFHPIPVKDSFVYLNIIFRT